MLDVLFGSAVRVAVLRQLLLHPNREIHLRDLIGRTGAAPRSVQVEVDRLVRGGILRQRRSGNRRYLSANVGYRLYQPLMLLLERSVGVLPAIEETLAASADIDGAVVFGSVARGDTTPASDVDLLIVGDIALRAVVKLLRPLEEHFDVEINPVVMTRQEYERRCRDAEPFITSVLRSPTIDLIDRTHGGA